MITIDATGNINGFDDDDTIYFIDHMPATDEIRISISGVENYFRNTYKELLEGINLSNKKFKFQTYLWFDEYHKQAIYTGEQTMQFIDGFFYTLPNYNNIPEFDINFSFSFMSNRPRWSRYLSAVIIKNWFDDCNFKYSYISYFNKDVANELLHNCNYNINTELVLQQKTPYGQYPTELLSDGVSRIPVTVPQMANKFKELYDPLFSETAISLISEPTFFEKGAMLTEKTVMSIYAGHFPIWLGNYGMPNFAKKFGLDIFDDVIDHSYQYIDHPGKRVVEAFIRNQDLLRDLKQQQKLRELHKDRLNSNLAFIRNRAAVKQAIQNLNS